MSDGFHWYASADGEEFNIGPCDSRAEVIAEATRGDTGLRQGPEGHWDRLTFTIIEARKDNIVLSKHFCIDSLVDNLLCSVEEEHFASSEFQVETAWTAPAQEELGLAMQALIDQWQERHKIEIEPWTFSQARNREVIDTRVPLPAA